MAGLVSDNTRFPPPPPSPLASRCLSPCGPRNRINNADGTSVYYHVITSTRTLLDWTLVNGFETFYKNTLSICAGAFLGMFYLWPMMALQLGLGKPSFWFFKLGAYVVLGVAMVILGSIPGLDLNIG